MNVGRNTGARTGALYTACICLTATSMAPPALAQGAGQAPAAAGGAASCGRYQPSVLSTTSSAQATVPTGDLQALQTAEQEAKDAAIAANNYSATATKSLTNQVSNSIQTGTNLAAATNAAGVQEFLIDFASALADLASVSDFFEGVAKGDLSDNSLLQNIDSIYEAAKDGESAANNLADQFIEAPEGTSTSPINDAFGTMGVADDYWGTDGLTNINSLKSDYSDIVNLIDEYREKGKINPRTLGQLIFRVGKGIAENDLAERKQQIADLQRDLAAEQCTTSGLAQQAQEANEAKWQALDRLAAIRQAELETIQADPTALAATAPMGVPGAELVTTDCPSCQNVADAINRARAALRETGERIAQIESAQQLLEIEKARLKALQDELARFDRTTAQAREGFRSTDVPVLGPSQELQNDINLREMDRRAKLADISRLENEIAIEEGNSGEQLAALQKARSELLESLRSLRARLADCEASCPKDNSLGRDLTGVFGALFGVGEADLPQTGAGFVREGAYGAAPDEFAVLTDGRDAVTSWGAFFEADCGLVLNGGVSSASSTGLFDIAPGGGVDSGIVYGGLSPSGSSGIATPFGLSGTASVDYRTWHIGGGYKLLNTDSYDLGLYGDFSRRTLRYESDAWGMSDYSGYSYEFGQSRLQRVRDSRVETGVFGTYRFAPMSPVSPYLGFGAGIYHQSSTLRSQEYNTSNFGPSSDQDFMLQFDEKDNAFGFHGRAESGIEFEVAPTWSLVVGASADYRSKVGGVWNPYSGDQVYYDGMTIRLDSTESWNWRGFGGIRLRF